MRIKTVMWYMYVAHIHTDTSAIVCVRVQPMPTMRTKVVVVKSHSNNKHSNTTLKQQQQCTTIATTSCNFNYKMVAIIAFHAACTNMWRQRGRTPKNILKKINSAHLCMCVSEWIWQAGGAMIKTNNKHNQSNKRTQMSCCCFYMCIYTHATCHMQHVRT